MSINIRLDGKDIIVGNGETILQVARQHGLEIPTLCDYKSELNGVCRLCMVEVGKPARMVPACSTKVENGMVVNTDSDQINNYRRDLLALILKNHSRHPEEQESRCTLAKYAIDYAVPRQGDESGKFSQVLDDSHPGIAFDPGLCILCRRCLIACDFDQVNEVIGLSGRGSNTIISFDLRSPMGESSCVSCGACVDACPTGALIEKDWAPVDRTEVTICPYCAVGCSVEYGIKGNSILWARGYNSGSVNDGKLCVKGKFGFEFEMSKERLRVPLIRRELGDRHPLGGRKVKDVFREATWKEALDLMAQRMIDTKRKYGPTSIGGIACDRATNEDVYAFQKFMRSVVGSDNVDQSATLCHAPSAAMLSYATGAGASTNPIDDIKNARTILMAGSNVDKAHPVLSSVIKRAAKKGANLVIVDPRKVELSRLAQIEMNLKPGTDVPLFSAMAKYIIDNGLADEDFARSRTENYDEFSKSLEPFTIPFASRITGIPEETIIKAAYVYATKKPSMIFWTLGITEHANGSDNVSSLVNLALVTGNVGKPGTGLNPIRGQNNVQGGADMGAVAGSLPGYQPLLDKKSREKFEKKWRGKLPESPGWKSTEMIEEALKGSIKLLYISGENSVRSHPNSSAVKEALKKLDFFAVQDIFMTETAEYADIILPAASSFEKSGTFTNTERKVQMIRPIFSPPGQAKADWEIYTELARRMGSELGFDTSAQIMDEISELVPIYAGVSHSRLEGEVLRWPVKDKKSTGTEILHVDEFMRGKARFRIVSWKKTEPQDTTYPYALITGRNREHYHTSTMTSRSRVIREMEKGSVVEMNPEDMANEQVFECERIEVNSRNGSVEAQVRANPALPSGVMFTTFHYRELDANALTPDVLDPLTKTPAYKDARVYIRKIRE